jgi:hypothetical protein
MKANRHVSMSMTLLVYEALAEPISVTEEPFAGTG